MRKLLLLLVAVLTVLSIQTKAQTTVTVGTNASTVNYFPIIIFMTILIAKQFIQQ
jgi:hypothetical protein